jgi:hypothetical protein
MPLLPLLAATACGDGLSADKGDILSAEAWHDIADAAALILTRVN